MKKLTVIALSLIAAGAAMADGLSREQVVAELQRARAADELVLLNSENPEAFGRGKISTASKTNRAAVLAELTQARAAGELERVDSESYGTPIALGSTRSRTDVVAELQRARANGQLDTVNGDRSDYQLAALTKTPQSDSKLLAGNPVNAQ
ncbi:MAG TPA: hypothetical protein VJN44_04940 [Roseateles sp.]|nr:hypothetical protein [Roseateles sp.]